MGRRLRSGFLRIHRPGLTENDAVVDAVLDVRAAVGNAEDALRVGFVFREQKRRVPFAVKVPFSKLGAGGLDDAARRAGGGLLQNRFFGIDLPGPLIAEPERRQDVQPGRLRAAVVNADLDEDLLGGLLGVFHKDVEVAILSKHPRIDQFVLKFMMPPPAAGLDQVGVRVGGLGILVEVLHVGMGRRAVEVEVIFLDVLPMVAFAVGQPEEAFLKDGIPPVPQRQGEAEPLFVVGEAGQAILTPAVGARAGLVMGEIIPGVTAFAVILAHGSPLALAEVGPPLFPGNL